MDAPFPSLDTLPPGDRRRAIARDVIAQLDAKRLIATQGFFVRLPRRNLVPTSLRATVADAPTCEVCALGGIIMAQLRVNGDCQLSEITTQQNVITDHTMVSAYSPLPELDGCSSSCYSPFLLRYFDADQLALIEVAFECGKGAFNCAASVRTWRETDDSDEYDEAASMERYPLCITDAHSAMAFGERYSDPDSRLRAIMASIEAHPEGLFIP